MNLKHMGILWLVVAAIFFSGCASTTFKQTFREELFAKEVDPEIAGKIEHGEKLELVDIEHLAWKSVSDDSIKSYIRTTRAFYELKTVDIDRLRAANASNHLIDFLISTPSRNKIYPSSFSFRHENRNDFYPYSYRSGQYGRRSRQ